MPGAVAAHRHGVPRRAAQKSACPRPFPTLWLSTAISYTTSASTRRPSLDELRSATAAALLRRGAKLVVLTRVRCAGLRAPEATAGGQDGAGNLARSMVRLAARMALGEMDARLEAVQGKGKLARLLRAERSAYNPLYMRYEWLKAVRL